MSKTITVETIINAPLDEVWDEVSKIENHSNWMKDAVNIDFQTNSRTGVGTKIKVLTKIGPIKLYDYMTFTKWVDKSVIGVDHVGIGSDFDGVGNTLPIGLKDASSYPNLIEEFLKRGYSQSDIQKILGGNTLRVWREVENYARKDTSN